MKYIRFIILLFITLSVYSVYQYAIEGVSIRKMRSQLPVTDECSKQQEKEFLKSIMNQPFIYSGKGCQFYVFSSLDDRHVLKFFKHKHLRSFDNWLELPMPDRVKQYLTKKNEKRKKRIENLFSSCRIACNSLSDETGIEWIHLKKTKDLNLTVTLVNKLGLKEQINLDDYECILQKKAIPAKDYLLSLSTRDQINQSLSALRLSVISRCQKGVTDLDPAFVQNMGFVQSQEGKALLIDFGQLVINDVAKSAEFQKAEQLKRFNSLKAWAKQNSPFLQPYIEDVLQQVEN